MEFFDKIGQKASKAYKYTQDKTGKIAKETKLKLKMNELKSEVNNIYEEIGRKVYEKHIREENISIKSDLESECTKIDVLTDEIEEILQQCRKLKNKKQCPKCYKEINKEDNFCSNCGEKQTHEEPNETEILEDLKLSEVEEDNIEEKQIVIEELEDDVNNKRKTSELITDEIDCDEKDEQLSNLEKTISVESDIDVDQIEELEGED